MSDLERLCQMKLKVKKLHPDAKLPSKKRDSDCGLDLYAIEDVMIMPGETVKIRTGVAVQLENEYPLVKSPKIHCLLLWDRSGLGSKGIHRLAGTIDESYTGEIVVCLTNLNIFDVLKKIADHYHSENSNDYVWDSIYSNKYKINKGDRICQMLIQEVTPVDVVEVEELDETDRGSKGFGSSGV